VLISSEQGRSTAYSLWNLEDRGPLFVDAGTELYGGMIIGEHNKGSDLEVNAVRGKQLTNVRASGKDEAVRLTTPIHRSLEEAIAYIEQDERVEVTPSFVRLRKALLDPNDRKRARRSKGAE
jgi:GTP-binding protein